MGGNQKMSFVYYWWEYAISKEQCELIIKETNWDAKRKGVIRAEGAIDEDVRKSEIVWNSKISPVGCILKTYTEAANKLAGWNYDINDMEEIQMAEYKTSEFYGWHADSQKYDNGVERKLSSVLLLSDPQTFEGGMFQFEELPNEPPLKQGSILVFPSFHRHKVTPVTKGVRYSAVTWTSGPNFK